MGVKTGVKELRVEYVGSYRITFLTSREGEVVGVIIEGPKYPRPLYIPKSPRSKIDAKIPEVLKKFLIKEGFKL